jgi:hypothetical protein
MSMALERLGDQGGEVIVLGADGEFSSPASRPPKVARGSARLDGPAKLEREVEAEPEESGLEVLALAPALGGLGPDACGSMTEDDGRLDLVPVLAARTRPPGKLQLALGGQRAGVERGRVARHAVSTCLGNNRLVKTQRSSPSK